MLHTHAYIHIQYRTFTFISIPQSIPRRLPDLPPVSPPWDPYGAAELKDLPPSAAALARRAQFPSAEAAYSNFKSKAVFKTWDPRTLSAYVRFGLKAQADGSCALKCVPMVEARSYMLPSTQKYWPDLPRIQTPITLIR